MKKLILLFFCLILISSCHTLEYYQKYEIRSEYDEFEQLQRDVMVWNVIKTEQMSTSVINIALVHKFHKPTNRKWFEIEPVYSGEDWIFLREEKVLTLLIDGRKVYFDSKDRAIRETKSVDSKVYCVERVYCDATEEQLYEIANAKSVKVKVSGSTHYLDGEFTKNNFKNFKKFLDQFKD